MKNPFAHWEFIDWIGTFVVIPVLTVCLIGMFCKGVETIISIFHWFIR